jgi:uncharacterized cupredoxin-like copper-binding protein
MASKLNGAQAYCVVKDKYGIEVKSSVVTIKMPSQPKVTTQPKSVTQVSGKTVKFTVKASGEGLKYQWYYAKKGSSSFKKLSGATKATYSVKVASSVNGRKYYCLVTDKHGQTVKSSAVTLTMKTVAKITTQPKSVKVLEGQTAKVTLKATGDDLSYKWYYRNPGETKYTYTSSFKSNSYSVTMNEARDGRYVYCKVYDGDGNYVKSNTVSLRMAEPVKITAQPKNVTVASGESAKVSVTASGDGLTYQWYVKNAGKSSFSKSSVTKSTYSVTMSSSVNGRQVYCIVTDKYGNTRKTNTVTLTSKAR